MKNNIKKHQVSENSGESKAESLQTMGRSKNPAAESSDADNKSRLMPEANEISRKKNRMSRSSSNLAGSRHYRLVLASKNKNTTLKDTKMRQS